MLNPYDWIEDSFKHEKKEYKACSKTDEEIKELLFDESVAEPIRLERNLQSDNYLRKVSVYQRLEKVLPIPACCEKIWPIIKQQLPSDSKDMQITAAAGFVASFSKFAENPGGQCPLPQSVLLDLFHLCLIILGQWNTEVIDEWVKVCGSVIGLLEWPVIKDKLTELINALSLSSQPKQSRYAAARLLAAVAKTNKGKYLEGPIFSRAIHLCQDCEKEVRVIMASEAVLPLYAAIDTDVCRNFLLEKVLDPKHQRYSLYNLLLADTFIQNNHINCEFQF